MSAETFPDVIFKQTEARPNDLSSGPEFNVVETENVSLNKRPIHQLVDIHFRCYSQTDREHMQSAILHTVGPSSL